MAIVGRFDERLLEKQAREKRRITNREIARHFGVTESTVWRWRRGDGFDGITLARAHELAEWLGCTIDALIDVVDEQRTA